VEPMRRLGDVCGGRLMAALWLAGVLDASMPVTAKDLGVWGEVWPIEEADLLEQVEETLEALQRSGEWTRMEEAAKARARERLEAPPPVPGIVPASEPRSWLYDPAIVVQEDVLGPGGIVIAPAGTRIEPLSHRPMTQALLFIDGTRRVEVQWALAQVAPTRIVLLSGRPFDLARAHGRAFYFDQGGVLAQRFGLRATPARMRQEGLKLRIEEVPLRGADIRHTAKPREEDSR
ncbi:MAG: type-F conjugative transfer system protein TraW, partial [Rhodospirillaceae bacterium]|nr:type-F conjugative transfer system protein TraW [Rhodospirillaceae bacterium]